MSKQASYVPFQRDRWKQSGWRAVTEYGPLTGWLAFFLNSAPNSNMAGIYEATLYDICRHTRMTEKEVRTAMANLEKVGFCRYDWDRQYVWDRTTLQRFAASKTSDKQVKGLQNVLTRLYESEEAPFIEELLSELERIAPDVHGSIMADGWLHYADDD